MLQILKMAFRDLGRNRRRSFFSALAVGGGLALLILMASVVEGEMGGALENTIRLQSGHIQIRAATYDENKSSLKWEDLVANPDELAAKIAAFDQVEAATPRLYASGFLSSGTQSAGAKITGIDPLSPASDPYRDGHHEHAGQPGCVSGVGLYGSASDLERRPLEVQNQPEVHRFIDLAWDDAEHPGRSVQGRCPCR